MKNNDITIAWLNPIKDKTLGKKKFYLLDDHNPKVLFENLVYKNLNFDFYVEKHPFNILDFNGYYFIDVAHKIPNFFWFYNVVFALKDNRLDTLLNADSNKLATLEQDLQEYLKQRVIFLNNIYTALTEISKSCNVDSINDFFNFSKRKEIYAPLSEFTNTIFCKDDVIIIRTMNNYLLNDVLSLYNRLIYCKKFVNHTIGLLNAFYKDAYEKISNNFSLLNGSVACIDKKLCIESILDYMYVNEGDVRDKCYDIACLDVNWSLNASAVLVVSKFDKRNGFIVLKDDVYKIIKELLKYNSMQYGFKDVPQDALWEWLNNLQKAGSSVNEWTNLDYVALKVFFQDEETQIFLITQAISFNDKDAVLNTIKTALNYAKCEVFEHLMLDCLYKNDDSNMDTKAILVNLLEHNEKLLPDFLKDNNNKSNSNNFKR